MLTGNAETEPEWDSSRFASFTRLAQTGRIICIIFIVVVDFTHAVDD